MKILYLDAYSSYPLARAGGHRSGHCLLRRMAMRPDVECMALMPRRGRGALFPSYDPKISDFETLGIREFRQEPGRWYLDCGYPIWAVDDVEAVVGEAFESFQPDLVYCQSPLVVPFLKEARARGLAAIWYVRDQRPTGEDLREVEELGVQLVALSRFAQGRILEKSGKTAEVVHSLIEVDDYLVERQKEGGYFTLINPIPEKGIEAFLGFAPMLPDITFLVVEAWPLGPELPKVEAQLAELPNVRFMRQQLGMHDVYRQTKLLLVPSTVPEGGPRVVREAGLSGIPAVGSARGAISEHLGDGGIIVDDHLNPEAWAEVLRPLANDPERLEQLSQAAWRNARREKFTAEFIVERFHQICLQAMRKVDYRLPAGSF